MKPRISYNEAIDLLNRRPVRLAIKLSNGVRRFKYKVTPHIPDFTEDEAIRLYEPFSDPVRTWSNQELRRFSHLFGGDIVNISGWEDKDKDGDYYRNYFPKASSYTITNYSQHMPDRDDEITLDLEQNLNTSLKNRFDTVFNHTILEHIYQVKKAYKNMAMMSRDVVITVVPFIQQQHEQETFRDYWRFTPTALRYLARDNGLEIIYENYRRDPYEITYIISVASKKPDEWKLKMPPYETLSQIADWIG
ncbi:MAG: hypothetical protein QY318_03345 [Candidatus Dojkabacteria bacterium]|nr:MAG: hypothetical protein QY318_03345 [Candidatus Dojkabacteria bacterium]